MDIFVGKLVRGNEEYGNGLVIGVTEPRDPCIVSHIIKVRFPKVGQTQFHHILAGVEPEKQSVRFIEPSPGSKWRNEDGSIKMNDLK
jgi:hypothetical protein